MQRAANFIRGWVEFQVTGDAPEEFFNLCARRGVSFWRLDRAGEVWVCRTSLRHYARANRLAEEGRCQLQLIRRGGLPGLFWQLRFRYALVAGLSLCLAAVLLAGQFVFSVQVSGNRRVPTGAILSQLRAQGVGPGTFGPGVDIRQVCHAVMLELPELSWMTLNLRGTVCEVLVREGVPRPELMEEDAPAHIVAKYPGVVTHVDATRGQQLVEEGQTVAEGDTLIGSWVDFVEPQYYVGDMGGMTVRAAGRVRARTWHTLKAAAPLTGQMKVFTGREKTCWSLEFFGSEGKISPRAGIPYEKYDKITQYQTASLPGGTSLPVWLKGETFREYRLESVEADRDALAERLRLRLERRLANLAREEEILRVDWKVEEGPELLCVTLLAECEQEIGMTVED